MGPPVIATWEMCQTLRLVIWAHGQGGFPGSVRRRIAHHREMGEVFRHPHLTDEAAIRRAAVPFLRRVYSRLLTSAAPD